MEQFSVPARLRETSDVQMTNANLQNDSDELSSEGSEAENFKTMAAAEKKERQRFLMKNAPQETEKRRAEIIDALKWRKNKKYEKIAGKYVGQKDGEVEKQNKKHDGAKKRKKAKSRGKGYQSGVDEDDTDEEPSDADEEDTTEDESSELSPWDKAWEIALEYRGRIVSDGDSAHEPPLRYNKPTTQCTEQDYVPTYLQNLRRHWLNNGGNEDLDIEIPDGYTLWSFERPEDRKHRVDRRLYGHPDGHVFQSVVEFYHHFRYLVARSATNGGIEQKNCPCQYC